MHPNNRLTINVVEGAPLEDFSPEVRLIHVPQSGYSHYLPQAVRASLAEALKVASGNGSEAEKLEARIEADVYEAIQAALAK